MFSPIRLRPESRSCRVAAHVLAGLLASSAAVAQSLQLTLVPSDHNGYHISCFGKKDGAIDLSVSGGTPPYTYTWSTGATTQDVSGLPSGFISVMVRDAANGDGRGEITLTEPGALRADAVPYVYASGFNISCNSCYNGSIQVTPHDGVSPYTYAWTDGPMSQNRSMLDAGSYRVDVFDANGCMYKTENLVLTQPERDDWSKSGNAGTTPGTHFMGTTDNKDLVLKSNGAERLRLRSDGKIKLFGNDTTFGLLYRDVDGILKLGTGPTGPVAPGTPCVNDFTGWMPLWKTNGNAFPSICPENPQPRLGTLNGFPLRIITDDQERMIVTTQGKVGIGTTSPSARLHVNGDLLIRDEELGDMIATSTGKVGIGTSAPSSKLHVEGDLLVHDGENGDIVTSSNPTTGPVLWARNGVAAWGLSIDGDGKGHILGDWNDPQPVMTFAYSKVGIGTDNMPGDDYNLFVSKGIITERVKVKLVENWPDHVFKPGYRLMPLEEVAAFIKRHGHLPNVPSAEEMARQGVDVARTDALLLEKIEELTLYVFQLQARLKELEARVNTSGASAR